MRERAAHAVTTVFELLKKLRHRWVINGPTIGIADQIALTDIGHVARFLIFSEKMIERLIAWWAYILRNGFVPFFAIGKDRVYIEDNAAEIEQAVANHFSNAEAASRLSRGIYGAARLARKEVRAFHNASNMALRTCKTSVLRARVPDMHAFCFLVRLGKSQTVG